MFQDLEQFVTAHRPCGALTSDVGELTEAGFLLLACACGAEFERWITQDAADRDLSARDCRRTPTSAGWTVAPSSCWPRLGSCGAQETFLAILLGLLAGAILVGCAVSPADRQATEQAWATRDKERASECAQRGGQWVAGGCIRGGGP